MKTNTAIIVLVLSLAAILVWYLIGERRRKKWDAHNAELAEELKNKNVDQMIEDFLKTNDEKILNLITAMINLNVQIDNVHNKFINRYLYEIAYNGNEGFFLEKLLDMCKGEERHVIILGEILLKRSKAHKSTSKIIWIISEIKTHFSLYYLTEAMQYGHDKMTLFYAIRDLINNNFPRVIADNLVEANGSSYEKWKSTFKQVFPEFKIPEIQNH